MRCVSGLLAMGLFAVGCSGGPAARQDDDLAVYEAVFRYRLEMLRGGAGVTAYLAVDGKDPPPELLKLLRADWPNLKPASEEPKEKGLRLYVEDLRRGPGDAVMLKAGSWSPSRFGGEGYFADHHVGRAGGRRVVEKVDNETMS